MFKNISAAGILGVDTGSLRKEFKDRQISTKTFNNLGNAKFDPYFPSEDIRKRFAEIANNLGEPNIYLEVAPTLRAMRTLFRQLPLDGNFDVEIDDFLFEPLDTAFLPQTGQPIITNQTQQRDPNTNLTRTQEALLSPEEKVIASRTV